MSHQNNEKGTSLVSPQTDEEKGGILGAVNATLRTLFPTRYAHGKAKDKITQALADNIASKIKNNEPLNDDELTFRSVLFVKEAKMYEKRCSIVDRAVEQAEQSIVAKGEPALLEDMSEQEVEEQKDKIEFILSEAEPRSDKAVEELYVRILAEEFVRPSSYSRRSIGMLRLLDRKLLNAYTKINSIGLMTTNGRMVYPPRGPRGEPVYESIGVGFETLVELSSVGLISMDNDTTVNFTTSDGEPFEGTFPVAGVFVRPKSRTRNEIRLPCLMQTKAGMEIGRLAKREDIHEEVLDKVLKHWIRPYFGDVEIVAEALS